MQGKCAVIGVCCCFAYRDFDGRGSVKQPALRLVFHFLLGLLKPFEQIKNAHASASASASQIALALALEFELLK